MGGMEYLGLGAMQLGSGYMRGKAEKQAYKMEAKQAGLEAKSAELERREDLEDALAMQAVIAGASGRAAGEGSLEAIRKEDVRRAGEDIEMIKAGGKAKAAALRSAGATAKTSSITSGILDAARTGLTYSQIGGKKGK